VKPCLQVEHLVPAFCAVLAARDTGIDLEEACGLAASSSKVLDSGRFNVSHKRMKLLKYSLIRGS
jgi:hypothetical protein